MTSPAVAQAAAGPVTGWWPLVRLQLRRDRVRLPVWLLGITAFTGAVANAVARFYDTPLDRAAYAAAIQESTVGRLIGGIPRDVDTPGGIISFECTAMAAAAVALMVCFLVVRHTRAEEESARAELVRAGVVGRHAALAAAMVVSFVASVLVGALLAAVLLTADVPVSAAVLFGAGMAGTGLVFTGVAAAAAQVVGSARRAIGLAVGALLAAYVVRGYGALDETWWTWASPFGWQDELRPFGDEARWWPLGISLAATVVALLVAAWLAAHRDFGAGLVAERRGPDRARGYLGTPEGLALRQQRGVALGWGVGLGLFAAVFGAVSQEVRALVDTNPDMATIIGAQGGDLMLTFLSFSVHFFGVTVAAFAVVCALRSRHDESSGYAEAVLSTGVSRLRWALSGVAVTGVFVVAMLILVGLAFGVSHAVVDDDWDRVLPLVGATLATAPAVLLLSSFVVLLHGWRPRWVLLGWVPVAWTLLDAYLGDFLQLPDAVRRLSVFHHLSALPSPTGESYDVVPFLVELALAALVTAVGVVGLLRRDLD